jgi:hypothetical protein
MIEWGGNDHLAVAVEIEQTAITKHHQSIRERQYLSINPKNDFDTTRITVENIDGLEYVLVFKNPTTLVNTNSKAIKTDASAADLKFAV